MKNTGLQEYKINGMIYQFENAAKEAEEEKKE